MQTPLGLRRGFSPTVFVLGDMSSTANRRLRDAFAATGPYALDGGDGIARAATVGYR
jgi:hypothetical protein